MTIRFKENDLPNKAMPPFEYEEVEALANKIRELGRHRTIDPLVLSFAVELTFYLGLKKSEIIRLTIGDVYIPGHGVRDRIPRLEKNAGGIGEPLIIHEGVKLRIKSYLEARFGEDINDVARPLFPLKNGEFYDERTLGRHLEKFIGKYQVMTLDKIRRMGICAVYDMALESGMRKNQAFDLAGKFGRLSDKETFDLLRNRIHFPKPVNRGRIPFDDDSYDDEEPMSLLGCNSREDEPEEKNEEGRVDDLQDEFDSGYFYGDDD